MKYVFNFILIIVFLGVCVFPTANNYLNVFENYNTERRQKIKVPKVKWEYNNIKSLPNRFDEYYSSNFGGRSFLFRNISALKLNLFNNSVKPKRFLIGKNKYMFLGDYWSNILKNSIGIHSFNQQWISHYYHTINKCNKWFKARNITFKIIVPANKHSIYAEDLPYKTDNKNTPCDVLAKLEVPVINLKTIFLNKKNTSKKKLYNYLESHWTAFGAFVGYKELMTALKKDLPNLKTIERTDFKIDSIYKPNFGTSKFIDAKKGEYFYTINFNKKSVIEKAKYYIPSWQKYKNKNALNNLKVIVLRDSYSDEMKQFLNRTFTEVLYVTKAKGNLFEKQKPDIFIFQVLERNTNTMPYVLNNVFK